MYKAADKTPDYNGLQRINRQVVIRYLRKMLEVDLRFAPLTIIGLEKRVSAKFTIETPSGTRNITIGGIIDRLDAITANAGGNTSNTINEIARAPQRIRVIDYKTGRDSNGHPKDVNAVFNSNQLKYHSDYYLQTMLYSLIVAQDTLLNPAHSPVSPGLMFIQQTGAADYDPTIRFGKIPSLTLLFMKPISKMAYRHSFPKYATRLCHFLRQTTHHAAIHARLPHFVWDR